MHTYRGGIRGRIDSLLQMFDSLVSGAISYAAMLALAVLVGIIYFGSSYLTVQLLTVSIGVFGGLLGAYLIYRTLDQEKNVQFFQGEGVVLESKTPKTYAVIAALGDRDVPLEPIRSNIYLTNLGILAERQGSGEATIFIPLDMITDISPHHEGVRLRAVDPRNQYIEAILFLEDKDRWIQAIKDQIDKMARIYR